MPQKNYICQIMFNLKKQLQYINFNVNKSKHRIMLCTESSAYRVGTGQALYQLRAAVRGCLISRPY